MTAINHRDLALNPKETRTHTRTTHTISLGTLLTFTMFVRIRIEHDFAVQRAKPTMNKNQKLFGRRF